MLRPLRNQSETIQRHYSYKMNITDGLKIIIESNGRKSLDSHLCCNILADYGVFKDFPGYKNIFRGIVEYGYMSKMLCLTKWEESINQWSMDLAIKKGYNLDWTKDIFSQIAESLELIKGEKDSQIANSAVPEFDFNPKTPSHVYEKFFSSLLNFAEVAKEGMEMGLSINNFQLRVRQYAYQFNSNIPYGYIDVSMELFRVQKLKRIRKLWMALYSKDDRIIKKFSIGEMRNDDSQLKPCIGTTGIELDKVFKIVLFWG